MNRIPSTVALACLVLPGMACAGEVFGKITVNGAAAKEGVTVGAKCGAASYPPVAVDKTGSYHLVLNEAGKCSLTVTQLGQSASVDVVSFDDAVQADLVLAVEGGKLVARRK